MAKLLTRSEVAARLEVSLATFDRHAARDLPRVVIGRCVRFREEDVDSWLRRHQLTPSNETTEPGSFESATVDENKRIYRTKQRQPSSRGKAKAPIWDTASQDVAARLRKRILAKSTLTDSGCIEWTGAKIRDGYGLMGVCGSTWLVHRVMYWVTKGDPGPCIDHRCRNRACVNVDHMEPVPFSVNVRRGLAGQKKAA